MDFVITNVRLSINILDTIKVVEVNIIDIITAIIVDLENFNETENIIDKMVNI